MPRQSKFLKRAFELIEENKGALAKLEKIENIRPDKKLTKKNRELLKNL